jgi:Cu(I)/Ag(I) efflux system membrane fusion protein
VDAAAQLQGKKSMMNKSGKEVLTGHEGHSGMEMSPTTENERLLVSSKFQEQFQMVFNDYIKLKDALVMDETKSIMTHAEAMLNSLNEVDFKLLKEKNAQTKWLLFEKELKSSVASISVVSSITAYRDHFKKLSAYLTAAIETFGINEEVYSQFCPMADSNRGAYWLSRDKNVLNPYFGDAMLTCGSVKQTIK